VSENVRCADCQQAFVREATLCPRCTGIEQGFRVRVMDDKLRAENERLHGVIDATAKHWLSIEGVPWEGAIDGAMEAAVGEIARLRKAKED